MVIGELNEEVIMNKIKEATKDPAKKSDLVCILTNTPLLEMLGFLNKMRDGKDQNAFIDLCSIFDAKDNPVPSVGSFIDALLDNTRK